MAAPQADEAVLMSGGMDSLAVAWMRRPQHAVTVDYGQHPARAELAAAATFAAALKMEHHVIRVDCSSLGIGDLAGRPKLDVSPTPEWWPFRNQLLVTLAAALLVRHGAARLLVGTLATDLANGDGSPEFVAGLDALLAMQPGGMRLEAPAIEFDAVGLVRVSGVPLELLAGAHSCHAANHACGRCRGCQKRADTWRRLRPCST